MRHVRTLTWGPWSYFENALDNKVAATAVDASRSRAYPAQMNVSSQIGRTHEMVVLRCEVRVRDKQSTVGILAREEHPGVVLGDVDATNFRWTVARREQGIR